MYCKKGNKIASFNYRKEKKYFMNKTEKQLKFLIRSNSKYKIRSIQKKKKNLNGKNRTSQRL